MKTKKTFITPYRAWCFLLFMVLSLSLCLPGLITNNTNPASYYNIEIASVPTSAMLPIIMYHATHHKNTGKYTLHPDQLERDFIYLTQNGYTAITVKDLLNYIDNDVPLPKKPVMLTFDDGSLTNYLYAFPLLQKYNLRAVFAVVGAWLDDNYDKDGNVIKSGSNINYEQLRTMIDSGLVEVQSHSYDMHKNKERVGMRQKKGECETEYRAALKEDLEKVKKRLRDKAGAEVNAIIYPYGAFSKLTEEVIKDLGYRAAFTCTEGINYINKDTDLFLLKRYNRPSGISSEMFFSKMTGQ